MKLLRIIPGVLASLVANAVLADAPLPSAQSLGAMEAVLHACGQVDPEAKATSQKLVGALKQMAPASAIEELRKSDDYHQAYDSAADDFGKMSTQDARDACTQYLAQFTG